MFNNKTIKQLADHLEQLAPTGLAVAEDNCGLLVGLMADEVKKVLLSLDVTPRVVDYAISIDADIIVSHHPYSLSPFKKINDHLLIDLIRNKIALLAMHTNLDFVKEGVNGELANILDLQDTKFLSPLSHLTTYHVAVYTPENAIEGISEAVFNAGAGIIENYSHCLNKYKVNGQFMPLAGSDPAIGRQGSLEELEETKMEFYTDNVHLDNVLKAMTEAHPYETPTYSVYPLHQQNPNYGLGLVGSLVNPVPLKRFAAIVKERLQAPFVKLWLAGNSPDTLVQDIAVCGGSGADLIRFAEQKADVYVTGDLKYHSIIASSMSLVDAGHFYTEYPIMPRLKEYLDPLDLDVEIFDSSKADISGLVCV